MGSSCSSKQSNNDNASIRSDDLSVDDKSQNDKADPSILTQTRSQEKRITGEYHKTKEKGALMFNDGEFSSCGDDGTAVGTPLSSSISGPGMEGSSKGRPPDKGDSKAREELPELSSMSEETRALIEGRILESAEFHSDKICVCLLGNFEDSKENANIVERCINENLVKKMRETGREVVVINTLSSAPSYRSAFSVSDLVSEYVKIENKTGSVYVVMFRGVNYNAPELPTVMEKPHFSAVIKSLTNEAEIDLLQKWYAETPTSFKLKAPHTFYDGLHSGTHDAYVGAQEAWAAEHRNLIELFARDSLKEQTKPFLEPFLKKEIEKLRNFFPNTELHLIVEDLENEDHDLESYLEKNVNRDNVIRTKRPLEEPHTEREERFKEISSKILNKIRQSIAQFKQEEEKEGMNPVKDGVKIKLLEEISCHHSFVRNYQDRHHQHGFDKHLNQIQKYLTSPTRKPLMIIGPSGSGKTALSAVAAIKCSTWVPDACVIPRFVGLTCNSSSIEALLYYLFEHSSVILGFTSAPLSPTNVAQNLQTLWKKSTVNRSIVIIIDGLDHFDSSTSADLLWLANDLPEFVKMILTVHENLPLYGEISNRIECQECFLKMDSSEETSETLFKAFMIRKNQNMTTSIWDKVQKSCNSPPSALYLLILSQLFFIIGTQEEINFSTLEEEIKEFFKNLEICFPTALTDIVLGCLSITRIGLLESEILSLFQSFHSLTSNSSSLDWLTLRRLLKPFLRIRIEDGLLLISWSSPSIRELASKYFLNTDERRTKCFEIFRKNIFRKEESRIFETSEWKENNKCVGHLRTLQESSNYLRMTSGGSNHFFDSKWLLERVRRSGPFKILEDISLALQESPQDVELVILKDIVLLSSLSFVYDSSQFYSQVYGRLKWRLKPEDNFPRLSSLLTQVSSPPLPCLLPLSSCLSSSLQEEPSMDEEHTKIYINAIFRIPGNPHHVITLSTSRSQVTVCNIFTMDTIRTLNGINQPRKLEMIDDYKCLLLCGRELRIYNLNDGTFLMKLREVMNQKMPFFGLHNSDHVVALSRSRMYVNMMNLTEGNCVTTFKVGEDRFLNSLMVSDNGKICVCGDDSQKPSALLVWDLELRKLMYDLRIHHHEFATRLAAITLEGHYVCCVCREVDEPAPNYIVVYDLQSGTLFKRWKPGVNTISIAISTAGTCVIIGLENSALMAYDLITGNPRWTVLGHCSPADTFRLDQQGLVLLSYDSQAKDQSLRVWDVPTGRSLAVLTPDQRITACEITSDGKAVILALEGRNQIFTFFLCHNETTDKFIVSSESYGDEDYDGKVIDLSQC